MKNQPPLLNALPLTLDAAALADVLFVLPTTIMQNSHHRQKSLPPFSRINEKPIWITAVVDGWLSHNLKEQITIDLGKMPLTLDAALLAALIYKSESTVTTMMSRSQSELPPRCSASTEKPIWLTMDVFKWLVDVDRLIDITASSKIEIAPPIFSLVRPGASPTVLLPVMPPQQSLAEMMMAVVELKSVASQGRTR